MMFALGASAKSAETLVGDRPRKRPAAVHRIGECRRGPHRLYVQAIRKARAPGFLESRPIAHARHGPFGSAYRLQATFGLGIASILFCIAFLYACADLRASDRVAFHSGASDCRWSQ